MIEKGVIMKFFKKNSPFSQEEKNNNLRIKEKVHNRIDKLRRKLSRGAANIFRIIKTRTKWGSKQLWGNREKGKQNLPTDKSKK